ncbi:MAG: UDP-N-acetylmuramoyl-tripeptide--D-alanyl-D-alanine ligase [Clostridia bacterium]
MEMLTLGQVAGFIGAEMPATPDLQICGICRDNRAVNSADIFVAIRGECCDGHDFLASAEAAGAVAAIAEHDVQGVSMPILRVPNSITALGALACGYRDMFSPRVVGITGSVGKTTTKEMIWAVLSEAFYTLKTQGNMNNEIGLPFTVLGLKNSHEAAVFEMGTNHFGEISRLTRIAKPDVAVITAIGESHIEFLGSKEGVRRAKLEILEGLKPGGTLILNGDDMLLWDLRDTLDANIIYYGAENPDVQVFGTATREDFETTEFLVRELPRVKFTLPCGGAHNLKNALAAVAVGLHYGIDGAKIAAGISKFANTGMRQHVTHVRDITILNDCYNASPDSMRAALNVLKGAAGRRIAVLGDMLELGDASASAHFEIGRIAAQCADIILAFGTFSGDVIAGAGTGRAFSDKDALCTALLNEARAGDSVLIKGSRGMKMEEICDRFDV